MPSWDRIVGEIDTLPTPAAKDEWVRRQLTKSLQDVGRKRGGRNVIFYASAFLQKRNQPALAQLDFEEINGLMAVFFGMCWNRGLTLILHTPGGNVNAAESIVAYVKSKFADFEVIVPTFAMSAGTMICLAANRIVMGRQSQLGPIDPLLPLGNGTWVSAGAIRDQWRVAKDEIAADPTAARAWAPVLGSLGPSLLMDAEHALAYGQAMVQRWLRQGMLSAAADEEPAAAAARYFSDRGTHKSHGRRIDRAEARAQGLDIEDLESDQELQEAVLTAYHLASVFIERTMVVKGMFAAPVDENGQPQGDSPLRAWLRFSGPAHGVPAAVS